ncbi:hypothetical protein DRJ25_04020 [Candidatus Woesearchaeota archaeon]|nr:MAG: hypothetical protein DRJ25_04020 [Candidatus Woesearchaeota archaeon]
MDRKAQAAMEFLMTYGWAILVVLAAIGALAYFGVLSPDMFVPEKCTMTAGIGCEGFKVTPTLTQLVLRNSIGRNVEIYEVHVGSCSISDQEISFDNGKQVTITLYDCSNGAAGSKFNGDLIIKYIDDITGLTKSISGQLISKIEADGTADDSPRQGQDDEQDDDLGSPTGGAVREHPGKGRGRA